MALRIESYLPSIKRDGAIPNTIVIKLPSGKNIRGLLDSDVSVSFQNRFGALVPDISGLADIASVFNMASMPAWIGASAQAWKGTDPIRLGVRFYLVNYKPGLSYEDDLEALATMCAMSPADSLSGGVSGWTVKIHGGYTPGFLDNNVEQFDGSATNLFTESVHSGTEKSEAGSGLLTKIGGSVTSGVKGTISVKIGNSLSLRYLLLNKLNITPSIVEVVDKKPLYYVVDADFQTCRAALSTDIEGMFG